MLDILGNVSQTEWIIGGSALGVLTLVLLAVLLLRGKKKDHKSPEPVAVSSAEIPPLLTPPELACFNALYEVAGKEYHVMAKVSLSDIAIVKRGVDKQLLDKVARDHHHIDFVLCTRDTISVTCAIELQDASKVGEVGPAEVLRQVGLPVFSLPRKTSYAATEIRKILAPFLKEKAPTPDEMVATISMEAFRVCNVCKTRMVLKRAKSGKYKGTLFWVCGRYPECRSMELFTR